MDELVSNAAAMCAALDLQPVWVTKTQDSVRVRVNC